MPKINEYKEHMVMPCAYFFVEGMKNANLHRLVDRLEYVESDYKANTLTVDIIDNDYVLLSHMLRGKKVYAMFGYKAKVLEFNGYIAKVTPNFSQQVRLNLFCLDGSYQLSRIEKSRSWSNCRRCDVARKIAIEHGLTPIIASVGKVQEKISQTNETDMQLLQTLAEDETQDSIGTAVSGGIGQIMYVAKVKGGALYFQPRKLSGESLRTLWYNINDCSIISLVPNEVTNTSSPPSAKSSKGGTSPDVNDAKTGISGMSKIEEEEAHLRKFHDDSDVEAVMFYTKVNQLWDKMYKPTRE